MSIENLKAYEIVEHRYLKDINSDSYILKHKKSGARLALMPNDDNNKVFYIGFRTPPKDSTGVAHIIEHTVLCGSKNFPVKDPFVELCKGSLNTFLNAMTYPDKTVYPVASCNDFDFQNLMNVYLDAVFFPNIYKEEKIFKQEGWHYELENKEDPLTINGVVYSEMKGAFSDPEDILERQILNSVFPDTPYSVESGGDPDVIPNLSYEDFLKFHGKFYHPSNSYIFLYGDMNMEEKLDYIDREYLSLFDTISVDSEIPSQKPFDEEKSRIYEYPVTENEDEEDKTYLNMTYCLGDYSDKELPIALRAFEYAFSGNPAASMRKAVLDAGIGNEFYASSDCSVKQNTLGFYVKGANLKDLERFEKIVKDELKKTVKEGFDKETILSFLVREEFKYREADFGRYPKGLVYGLDLLDSWLYDDNLVFTHIECIDTYKKLKDAVSTDYYEKLLEEKILNNKHLSIVAGVPKKGLAAIKDKALEDKLKSIKDKLSDEEVQKIIDDTQALREYQESEDSKEDLDKIKLLKVSDIEKKTKKIKNELFELDGTKFLKQNIFTSGIAYLTLYFDVSKLSKEDYLYLPLLSNVLGKMDTENMKYKDIANALKMYTGGINSSFYTYKNVSDGKLSSCFEINVKFLYENKKKVFELLKEIFLSTVFDDKKLLKEYISEMCSQGESMLMGAPHSVAVLRACSYFEEMYKLNDISMGLEGVRFIKHLNASFDSLCDSITENLKRLCNEVFREENLFVNLTSPSDKFDVIDDELKSFKKALFKGEITPSERSIGLNEGNEGFITSGQVQYVAIAGDYKRKGYEYTGALNVLKTILGYDYLWNNVRVKGGAYGCFANFATNGICTIVSYRDPHLNQTLKTYRELVDFLKNFECSDREMNQYIIGAISEIDMPQTPSLEGKVNCVYYLNGTKESDLQKYRDQILSCTKDDIKNLAELIEAAFSDNYLCTVGAEKKINDNSKLFDTIENLI